jgi:hypothetical protein
MIKKIKTEFEFSASYFVETEKAHKEVKIILVINYKTKTFDILNNNRYSNFTFQTSSHRWRMWKAVNECIEEAIGFAVEELELDK